MTAAEVKERLNSLASPVLAKSAARFFKTGPGEYGEGDIFIGIKVPVLRTVARSYRELPLSEIELLLHSPIHEERLLALLIMVLVAEKADDDRRKTLYDFYLTNTSYVNNWDLVDSSAPTLVGGYLRDKSRKPLVSLAKSTNLWERRIASVGVSKVGGKFVHKSAAARFVKKSTFDVRDES